MRIATYNIEWFSSLFDAEDHLINDDSWSGRYDVVKRDQSHAIADVLRMVDADAIMIIEAPDSSNSRSSTRALENFARHFSLRQNKAISGFANHTQQEISLLYDPQKMSLRHDPIGEETPENGVFSPRFDRTKMHQSADGTTKEITFSKPPLEVVLKPKPSGAEIRLIGVHAKSKAPHGAKNPQEAAKISIKNRSKQLAQCHWIRQRVVEHLSKQEPLIVLGDFNDGPGLDEYEKLFGQSGIEIVLGADGPAQHRLLDPHALQAMRPPYVIRKSTSRFYDHRTKTYLNALLDYIMISPDLVPKVTDGWKIWHPFDDPECFDCAETREALLLASDHFPVSLDIKLTAD
ncbi:endonuclease [Amylibacter marinus]|uniref:Endonuclease n=1 Tax=Amylibacter marinus TaxID=1475483 RepID=A0ABQ5VTS8_9RHOB|nr:endonuclease/exonuclease/phosphatase family protein [Amylibacter marinus]GLQ34657.1 endonuclease [Amylibacter marinus]